MIIKNRKFQFLNQYALQSLGFKNEKELIGKSVFSFVHPNYLELVLTRFHTVLEQKQPVEIVEEEWINANGETITVEVMSIPFHFMGDQTNLTIFHDVTEKKNVPAITFKSLLTLRKHWKSQALSKLQMSTESYNMSMISFAKFRSTNLVK